MTTEMEQTNKQQTNVLWAGRLEKKPEAEAFAFQASIKTDSRMALHDIEGSRAHVTMLGKQGVIPQDTANALNDCLAAISAEIASGKLAIDYSAEDIHSFIEGLLTERLGEAGKMVHAGRSRNDQVCVDFKMYCKEAASRTMLEIKNTALAVLTIAGEHTQTIMPGFTHLQRAQPVTLAHHLCAWVCALERDAGRFADAVIRLNECPLGAGALTGSTFPLDRESTAHTLGFLRPTLNSMDSIADRDFAVELAAACALTQTHLSRFCEDIVIWASDAVHFIALAEEWSTGSSIMPQKKNPDFAELIRGKSGRTTGNLITLLTLLKGLPYAYNKDLQEDKEALFDSFDTVEASLRMFRGMMASARFNVQDMRDACEGGFLEATDCAEYLVRKGLPFRAAHAVCAAIVRECIEHRSTKISEMSLEALQAHSPLFEQDIYRHLTPEACTAARKLPGGPAPDEVRRQIAALRAKFENYAETDSAGLLTKLNSLC
jgi:argininosuccinate lyase